MGADFLAPLAVELEEVLVGRRPDEADGGQGPVLVAHGARQGDDGRAVETALGLVDDELAARQGVVGGFQQMEIAGSGADRRDQGEGPFCGVGG
ncbi:hypothetical protein D3C86_1354200 [compost metagenome]